MYGLQMEIFTRDDQSVRQMQQLPLILVILFSYIIFIRHLEFHAKLSPITSLLNYNYIFSYFVMGIILFKIYPPNIRSSSFVEFFEILIKLSSKFVKSTENSNPMYKS